MRKYVDIYPFITPTLKENVKVDTFEITKERAALSVFRSYIPEGKYARLLIDGECMMSETPMEHRTNMEFVSKAYGDILIGGLGIGMIIMAIQDEENVNSITVVESNQNVIDIISAQVPFNDKVKIIHADVNNYKPTMKFDCIYMDIWNGVNSDIYQEMKKLKRKYGHYLKPLEESPNRFNKCWAEWEAKNNRRLY